MGRRKKKATSPRKKATSPRMPKEAYEEDLRVMFCTKAIIMAVTSDNEKRENEGIAVANAIVPLLNEKQCGTVMAKAQAYLKAVDLGWDETFTWQKEKSERVRQIELAAEPESIN